MRRINFERLETNLLHGGIAPKYVRRTISELKSHFEDLKCQELNNGLDTGEAEKSAFNQLGEEEAILKQILAKRELKTLASRFQKSVFLVLPLLLYPLIIVPLVVGVYEVIPVRAGINHWDYWPEWYYFLITSTSFVLEYLIAPFFALGFFLYAKHKHIDTKWPLIGILVMSFIAAGWDNTVLPPGVSFQRANVLFHWGYAFMPWRIVQSDWIVTIEQLLRIGFNCAMVGVLEMRYRNSTLKQREA